MWVKSGEKVKRVFMVTQYTSDIFMCRTSCLNSTKQDLSSLVSWLMEVNSRSWWLFIIKIKKRRGSWTDEEMMTDGTFVSLVSGWGFVVLTEFPLGFMNHKLLIEDKCVRVVVQSETGLIRFYSVVSCAGIYSPQETDSALSLTNDVCSCGTEEEDGEKGQCPYW